MIDLQLSTSLLSQMNAHDSCDHGMGYDEGAVMDDLDAQPLPSPVVDDGPASPPSNSVNNPENPETPDMAQETTSGGCGCGCACGCAGGEQGRVDQQPPEQSVTTQVQQLIELMQRLLDMLQGGDAGAGESGMAPTAPDTVPAPAPGTSPANPEGPVVPVNDSDPMDSGCGEEHNDPRTPDQPTPVVTNPGGGSTQQPIDNDDSTAGPVVGTPAVPGGTNGASPVDGPVTGSEETDGENGKGDKPKKDKGDKPKKGDKPGDEASDPTVGAPTPNNGQPVVNTVPGGTGEAQRDMDPTRPGTQINLVIDDKMDKNDRKNVEEAAERWNEVSDGEIEFLIHEEGEQPVGQDFTFVGTVPPDNTTLAGAADVGRSPDGFTEMAFEEGARLAVVMHEMGHTLGLRHGDGVMSASNSPEEFSKQNIKDLEVLYPNMA